MGMPRLPASALPLVGTLMILSYICDTSDIDLAILEDASDLADRVSAADHLDCTFPLRPVLGVRKVASLANVWLASLSRPSAVTAPRSCLFPLTSEALFAASFLQRHSKPTRIGRPYRNACRQPNLVSSHQPDHPMFAIIANGVVRLSFSQVNSRSCRLPESPCRHPGPTLLLAHHGEDCVRL